MDIIKQLKRICPQTRANEILAPHTSFRLGGPAKYFCLAATDQEIKELFDLAIKNHLPFFILGGGSNILVGDRGFDGLVIKIIGDQCRIEEESFICQAGTILTRAVNLSVGRDLTGLEWAAGIPGTVGGAVCGNAGAYGGEMSDAVQIVRVLRAGKILELKKEECDFSYRRSIFNQDDNQDIILSLILKLAPGNQEESRRKIQKIISERRKKFGQYFSAGSIFKNIEMSEAEIYDFKNKHPELPDSFLQHRKLSAGWLIDKCGLRGRRVGGAQIYEHHAGIIVNLGQAKAEDVVILISIIKQKVRSVFGVQLWEEIKYLGF